MEIIVHSTSKSQAAAQFNLVAPIYPALERLVFGSRLDDARQAFFEEALKANRVLLVGEGNGRFLKALVARKSAGFIKVVEKSGVMIHLAKKRAGVSRKVALEFIEADFRLCQPGKEFDCIVTHFFLDQFNPPAQLTITIGDRHVEIRFRMAHRTQFAGRDLPVALADREVVEDLSDRTLLFGGQRHPGVDEIAAEPARVVHSLGQIFGLAQPDIFSEIIPRAKLSRINKY